MSATRIDGNADPYRMSKKRSITASGVTVTEVWHCNADDLASFVQSKQPFGVGHPDEPQALLTAIEDDQVMAGATTGIHHITLLYATPGAKGGSDTNPPTDDNTFEVRADANAVDIPITQHPNFHYRVTQAMLDDPTTSPAKELPDGAVLGDAVFKNNKLKAGIDAFLDPQPSISLVRRLGPDQWSWTQKNITGAVGKLQRPLIGTRPLSGADQKNWLRTARQVVQSGFGESAVYTVTDSWQYAENDWDEDIYERAGG